MKPPALCISALTSGANFSATSFGYKFGVPHDVDLQIRLEAINALNYTVWWEPDTNPRNATFGYFRSQRNNPRDFQLGARLSF